MSDNLCDVCRSTGTAFRCRSGCDYDLCTSCHGEPAAEWAAGVSAQDHHSMASRSRPLEHGGGQRSDTRHTAVRPASAQASRQHSEARPLVHRPASAQVGGQYTRHIARASSPNRSDPKQAPRPASVQVGGQRSDTRRIARPASAQVGGQRSETSQAVRPASAQVSRQRDDARTAVRPASAQVRGQRSEGRQIGWASSAQVGGRDSRQAVRPASAQVSRQHSEAVQTVLPSSAQVGGASRAVRPSAAHAGGQGARPLSRPASAPPKQFSRPASAPATRAVARAPAIRPASALSRGGGGRRRPPQLMGFRENGSPSMAWQPFGKHAHMLQFLLFRYGPGGTAAASAIQAGFRRLKVTRTVRVRFGAAKAAAREIQRVFRGWRGRKFAMWRRRRWARRTAAVAIQLAERGRVARRRRRQLAALAGHRRAAAARVITRAWRRLLRRRRLAALRIARCWRGWVGRREAAGLGAVWDGDRKAEQARVDARAGQVREHLSPRFTAFSC